MWDEGRRTVFSIRHVHADIYSGSSGWYLGLPAQGYLLSLILNTEDIQILDQERNSVMLWYWAAGQDEEDRLYPFELEHDVICDWKRDVLAQVFAS